MSSRRSPRPSPRFPEPRREPGVLDGIAPATTMSCAMFGLELRRSYDMRRSAAFDGRQVDFALENECDCSGAALVDARRGACENECGCSGFTEVPVERRRNHGEPGAWGVSAAGGGSAATPASTLGARRLLMVGHAAFSAAGAAAPAGAGAAAAASASVRSVSTSLSSPHRSSVIAVSGASSLTRETRVETKKGLLLSSSAAAGAVLAFRPMARGRRATRRWSVAVSGTQVCHARAA